MRKLMFVTIGLFFATTVFAQSMKQAAQYISLGPVTGAGGNWVGNMGGTSRIMPSGNVGVGLIYARKEHWGWGGQLTVATEGYKKEYNGNEATAVPVYLRLPARAYYFFNGYKDKVRPKLFLGPELGIKIAERDNLGAADADVTKARNTGSFRTLDAGINTGGGINIMLRRSTWLNLDLTYYQGLIDVVKDAAGNYNVNHNLGVSAGLLLGIK